MKLHENERLFRQAVQFTSDELNIAAIYVEKDYWVTIKWTVKIDTNL